jgi:hypothetical protein
MKRATDYLRHAEECRVLARGAASDSERKQLLTMAETWETLAAERQTMMRLHPELFRNTDAQK